MSLGGQSPSEPLASCFHVSERIGFGLLRMAIVSPDPSPFNEMVGPQYQEGLPKGLVAQRPATSIAPALPEPLVRQVPQAANQVFAIVTESCSRAGRE